MKPYAFAITVLWLSGTALGNDSIQNTHTRTQNVGTSNSSSFDSDFSKKLNEDLQAIKRNEKDSAYQQQMNQRNFDCATGVYGSANCSYVPNNRFGRGGSTSYSSSKTVSTRTTTTTSQSGSGEPTTTTTTTRTSSSYSNFPRSDKPDNSAAMQSIKDMEKSIVRMNQGGVAQ